nr:hypothetical protein [Prevotella sp.]
MNERQKIAAFETAAEMNELNKKWYSYILDSIHSDDVDISVMSDKMKIEFALNMFYEEKVKNDKRNISRLELLTDWLQGLCSTVNIAFTDYDIMQIGEMWKTHDPCFVENWFRNTARKMIELAATLGVRMDKYLY